MNVFRGQEASENKGDLDTEMGGDSARPWVIQGLVWHLQV